MRWKKLLGSRRSNMLGVGLAAVGLILFQVPAALAFPHVATVGATTVYSDVPIDPALPRVLARADALLAASSIDQPGIARTVVLTDGGWRWRVLAVGYADAIALRRPFSSVLLFNRSDVGRDRVSNGAAIGGVRSLSGTIAHETTHLLVARHLGEWRAMMLPAWKSEGYADVIAGETSLGVDDERRIRAANPDARVLHYYEGRRRVTAALARNGGSVDALFDD